MVDNMNEDNELFTEEYRKIGEYWDSHSVADQWEQTEPAEFEISPTARRRYLVAIDPTLLTRIQTLAKVRGLSTESLVNLLLEQHLHTIEAQS